MPTFRDVQDRINLDYLNRTDLGSETKRAIIRAVKHYEKNRFWFNMTATALAVGTASVTVAVPADFLALDYATVRDTSVDYIVTVRTFDRIAYQNTNLALGGAAASGVAKEIAYYRDAFFFTPKPSSVTSITVYYTQSLATLSADSDTNGWLSAAEDLIVHHATADLLANVLRVTDNTQVQAHKAWETEAFAELQKGNAMRIGSEIDNAVTGSSQPQKPKVPGTGLA